MSLNQDARNGSIVCGLRRNGLYEWLSWWLKVECQTTKYVHLTKYTACVDCCNTVM